MAEATTVDGAPDKAKKHASRKRKVDASALSPEEVERRKVQRQLRELALQLRAQGKEYKPQKYKRKMFKSSDANKTCKKSKADRLMERMGKTVVVLPIYWQARLEEMEAVVAAAEKVKGILDAAGVKNILENNNKYMPGERMKYWETKGVKVRIEIGPKEAQGGTCVVAVSSAVGSVANKRTVKVEAQLQQEVQGALEKVQKDVSALDQQAGSQAGGTVADAEQEDDINVGNDQGSASSTADPGAAAATAAVAAAVAAAGTGSDGPAKLSRRQKKALERAQRQALQQGSDQTVAHADANARKQDKKKKKCAKKAQQVSIGSDMDQDEDDNGPASAAQAAVTGRALTAAHWQGNMDTANEDTDMAEANDSDGSDGRGSDGDSDRAGSGAQAGTSGDADDEAPSPIAQRAASKASRMDIRPMPAAAAAAAAAGATSKQLLVSGDALDDDFDIDVEPEEEKATMSKVERAKKRRKDTKLKSKALKRHKSGDGGNQNGIESPGIVHGMEDKSHAGKKGSKVVVFK